jgi:hypothetical protein
MRQFTITTFTLLLLWNCNNFPKENGTIESPDPIEEDFDPSVGSRNTKNEWNYREVKRNYLDSIKADICSTEDLEFINLYPIIDSIASDKYENSIIAEALKALDFKETNWERGNWMKGPRIVRLTMSNLQCECQVDKLYYSTAQEGKYKVTERIACNETSR